MDREQTKQMIREYTDRVWNEGAVEAMDRYYAPDYRHQDVSRPDVTTLDDYKAWARALQAGLSDLNVEIDDLIAEGDKAVKVWTASGRHTGELAGAPPTGDEVSFRGVTTYRVKDGRIVESTYVYDLFGLAQQLQGAGAAG